MNDFTLQQELEALAGNAFNPDDSNTGAYPEPIATTMARWRKLFNLSEDEVIDRIMENRNNLTRTRISDAHWDTVRSEKEAEGFDREAYEYNLDLQKKRALLPELVPGAGDEAKGSSVTYLIELSGPLDTPAKVQAAAHLPTLPSEVSGQSVEEGRPVRLCCVDGDAKAALLQWASREGGGFEPTILVDPRSL